MQIEAERELQKRIGKFSTPNNKTALFELGVTFCGFLTLSGLMIYGLAHHVYWLALILLPFAAVLITRLFTIQHDCGHGSYFSSQKVNNAVGCLLGVLTLTPYYYWRKNHSTSTMPSPAISTSAAWAMSTRSRWKNTVPSPLLKKNLVQDMYRNPVFILFAAPLLLFGVKHRLPLDCEFHSVKAVDEYHADQPRHRADGFHACPFLWRAGVFLRLSACHLAGQRHRHDDVLHPAPVRRRLLEREQRMELFRRAALQGSSYFEFSRLFSWLVGNINLHHIHHLNGRVPSYRLRECLTQVPELQAVVKRTLTDIPPCFKLALWDDKAKKMVGFSR